MGRYVQTAVYDAPADQCLSWCDTWRSATFWPMLGAFSLVGTSVHACIIHMAALLADRGATAQAAALASSLAGGGILISRLGGRTAQKKSRHADARASIQACRHRCQPKTERITARNSASARRGVEGGVRAFNPGRTGTYKLLLIEYINLRIITVCETARNSSQFLEKDSGSRASVKAGICPASGISA
jgi:hypothetical protein